MWNRSILCKMEWHPSNTIFQQFLRISLWHLFSEISNTLCCIYFSMKIKQINKSKINTDHLYCNYHIEHLLIRQLPNPPSGKWLRGMCGHLVYLRIKVKTFIELAPKLLKLLLKDKNAINMRFYVLFWMQIAHTRAAHK